ncbi:hypothetical protein C8R45DRAFT_1096241 [Mycena sanguinolenta]|nr:hypothetical protein C8R45DRAFT_1096241 [Mycena sanguinolenta]
MVVSLLVSHRLELRTVDSPLRSTPTALTSQPDYHPLAMKVRASHPFVHPNSRASRPPAMPVLAATQPQGVTVRCRTIPANGAEGDASEVRARAGHGDRDRLLAPPMCTTANPASRCSDSTVWTHACAAHERGHHIASFPSFPLSRRTRTSSRQPLKFLCPGRRTRSIPHTSIGADTVTCARRQRPRHLISLYSILRIRPHPLHARARRRILTFPSAIAAEDDGERALTRAQYWQLTTQTQTEGWNITSQYESFWCASSSATWSSTLEICSPRAAVPTPEQRAERYVLRSPSSCAARGERALRWSPSWVNTGDVPFSVSVSIPIPPPSPSHRRLPYPTLPIAAPPGLTVRNHAGGRHPHAEDSTSPEGLRRAALHAEMNVSSTRAWYREERRRRRSTPVKGRRCGTEQRSGRKDPPQAFRPMRTCAYMCADLELARCASIPLTSRCRSRPDILGPPAPPAHATPRPRHRRIHEKAFLFSQFPAPSPRTHEPPSPSALAGRRERRKPTHGERSAAQDKRYRGNEGRI